MRFSSLLPAAFSLLLLSADARDVRHIRKNLKRDARGVHRARRPQTGHLLDARDARPVIRPEPSLHKRAGPTLIPQNKNTTRFAVDGTGLPDVHFDIGESYAGLLPISDRPNEKSEFYFWFFPTENEAGKDEITIWLNGGPGCSSLEGLLQENGKFIWQYGTYQPIENPYSWTNLTNMIWIEQPVGTGFSQGKPIATNETVVAAQFLGFFKRFVDTFGLQKKKIYITGESYAGQYIPYIADAMYNNGNKDYYDVQGILIYDPSTSYDVVQQEIPTLPFVNFHQNLFSLNQSFLADINKRDVSCGYADFRKQWMTFPPKGKLPTPPQLHTSSQCDIYGDVQSAVFEINPCFDVYQVATTCPMLWDVLGFPGSFEYSPIGAPPIYFNRPEVQKAINAPIQEWGECSNGVLDTDTSPPTGLSVLPSVIDRSKRTVIAHGQLDMILIPNGTLMMIQNMTWGGKQGFQREPKTPFFVPYHTDYQAGTVAGAGRFGTTHTERKLTWVEVYLSGHMVPQYAPSAAYRHLEFLLGRIDSLNDRSPFTTQK